MESIEQIAINEFEKLGDDGLFPNHTDKDIWVSGFKSGFEFSTKRLKMALALDALKELKKYIPDLGYEYDLLTAICNKIINHENK